jgi:hypothetical protein
MAKKITDSKAEGEQNIDASDELEPLRLPEYTEPIEELTELLSQSKRSFILGAGCSKCAGLLLMEDLTKKVLTKIPKTDKAHTILQGLIEQFSESKGCTIEDYMSDLVDFISMADRRESRCAKIANVPIGANSYSAAELRDALATIKQNIELAIIGCEIKIHNHRQFIRVVHGRLQSGKSGPIYSTDYFTLNYDTLLEDALSLEKIPLADGFNGGVTGWWNVRAYDDSSVSARVFKVHGSIDWCLLDDDVLPRRVRNGLKDSGKHEPVLIWPAATKYREAQRDPFAQILNIMRQTLRPAQNSEVVLAVVGYAFNDSHINDELDRALIESDGRLTIIVFTSADKPEGLLDKWRKDPHLKGRVRIHAKRGFFHADKQIGSKVDLPWWKFEVLIRILGGDR